MMRCFAERPQKKTIVRRNPELRRRGRYIHLHLPHGKTEPVNRVLAISRIDAVKIAGARESRTFVLPGNVL
jgi:hypothetical protein